MSWKLGKKLKEGALSARSPSLIGGNLDRSATPTPGNPDPSGLPSSSSSTSYPSSSNSASASGSMPAPSFPPSSSSSSSASASTSSAGGAAHVSGYNHNPLASSTGAPISRNGLLSIAVLDARGLSLPQGQQIPPAILKALQSQQSQSQAHPQHHHQHHNGAGGGGGASVSGPGSLTGMFAASSLDGSGGRSGAGAGAGGGSSNGLPPASSSSSSTSSSGASLAKTAASNRHSLQRRQHWWLPYVVLEFDKNEVLIDAIGGDLASPSWVYKANFDVSRNSEISLQLYLRSSTGSGSSASSGVGAGGKAAGGGGGEGKDAQGDDVMSVSDLYLGGVKFIPDFENARGADEWFAVSGGGTGQVRIQVAFRKLDHPGASLNMEAFELLKVIGKGSFGKVMQVRKKDTGRIYALKTIRKAHIVSRSEVTHTLAERTVLARVNNPFIVPLKFSFQSPEKLYLVLAFVNGGELFHHLQREGRFNEERSRFYAAELLCALEHLHGFNVIYRDLKPENILLDYNGHIALCDFGLCKLNMGADETTNTFCGTPEYLAPELLLGHGYTKAVDWWTLGVLLYEMLTGLPPFYSEDVNEMYRKILQDPLRFGDEVRSDARSLLTLLLNRDPAQRLGNGANGAEVIKSHPFFAKHIDWKMLLAKKVRPPFKPSVASAIDTSNFDPEFTNEVPTDSVVDDSHMLSATVQEQFVGFSYNGPNELQQGESLRD